MLRSLTRPEYIFRPKQIWKRLRNPWSPNLPPFLTVEMPWRLPLRIRSQETIGRLIWTFGVFDLPVTEALWRLTDEEDTVVDAGANLGCMSCLFAFRCGTRGEVLAFEPFPEVHAELATNLALWRERRPDLRVRLFTCALGAIEGRGTLGIPDPAQQNRGLARVETGAGEGATIEIRTLDSILGTEGRIGVIKIDVEGGELDVLRGAERLLREKRVRDLVFEDHGEYPTPVTRYLSDLGYTVFSLRNRLSGLVVKPADQPTLALDALDSQSFLATSDPARLLLRLRRPGWLSLKANPRIV